MFLPGESLDVSVSLKSTLTGIAFVPDITTLTLFNCRVHTTCDSRLFLLCFQTVDVDFISSDVRRALPLPFLVGGVCVMAFVLTHLMTAELLITGKRFGGVMSLSNTVSQVIFFWSLLW